MVLIDSPSLSLSEKLRALPWGLMLTVCCAVAIGLAMLYSAAKGNWDLWASRQASRFGIGVGIAIGVALIDTRYWFRYAYLIYFFCLCLLIGVEFLGVMGGGAQRWLVVFGLTLQPSEVMKIGIVLALARYFQTLSHEEIGSSWNLIIPVLLVLAPTILVMQQPDLGTGLILFVLAGVVLFLAGVRWWVFIAAAGVAIVGSVLGWVYGLDLLKNYQRERILTFFDPNRDPTGAGYHIIQSKIAVGSGGLTGKGFMQGTQSQLDYLPEKQTDFIFTMLAEEQGLLGASIVILLYSIMLIYGHVIALNTRSQFARLLAGGITFNLFLYVFINIAMVIGLVPVVGVPLPLISYGGTALLALMLGFGLLMSVAIHRDMRVGKNSTMMES